MPGTRPALDALIASGVLPKDDGAQLAAGYAFLRDLEGRLRIERDQPVEAIDTDPGALLGLARRLGHDGDDAAAVARVQRDLERHRTAIRDVHTRLFATA